MKVITTFHPPSSVLDSLKCTLKDESGSEFLVVAKLNRVDFYSIQPGGLRHEQGLEIWGRVRAVRTVPIVHKRSLSVLVLTDHPEAELIFLRFTVCKSGETELMATKYLSLFERSSRSAEFCHDVLVDPSGAIAVVSVYTGRLKVVILDQDGGYESDFDASILELNLFSLAFISASRDSYTLAMLHFDFQQRIQLLARDVNVDELQLSPSTSPLLPPIPLPGKLFSIVEHPPRLIFVPSMDGSDDDFEGGILVVGGREILLYDLASKEMMERNISKSRRTEKRKRSEDAEEATKAKQKEQEREWRKKKARAAITWPWSEVAACCSLDQDSNRFLIGDKFGRLVMLCVDTAGGTTLTLVALGEAPSPTTLTYLTNQVVYLGSHFGDSQLLRINSHPVSDMNTRTLPVPSSIPTIRPADLAVMDRAEGNAQGVIINGVGSYITEMENFKSLAPIIDAVLVDTDSSGQNEIVTCSGGRNTGSLNVVRSGADFRETAFVQGIPAAHRIWPLRERYRDREHTHIVVSTLHDTYVFRFDDDYDTGMSSVGDSKGIMTSCRTLAISNILRRSRKNDQGPSTYTDSSLVVQVVPTGLLLLNYDSGTREYSRIGDLWTLDKFADANAASWAGREIVAADVNASQVVIALNYGRLVLLNLDGDRFVKQRVREFVEDPPRSCTAEISAVTCIPLDSTKAFALRIAVAFWTSNHVRILSLQVPDNMMDVCRTEELPATPRSLLLHNFTNDVTGKLHPHLLVGLTDGSTASFAFNSDSLVDQKLVSVGTLPVSLHSCEINGRSTVFACGSRTSILFWEKERLQHSPLMLKDVSAVAALNTKSHPGSVVLSGPDSLVIGAVTNFDKLHIRKVSLGYDNPRCIVHSLALRAFIVACMRTTPGQVGQAEAFSSSLQLFDDTSFEKLDQVELNADEEVTALHSFSVTWSGEPLPIICAGVTTYDDKECEPSQGRLVMLQVPVEQSQTRAKLVMTDSLSVKGSVYAVTSVNDDTVVAAVNSSIIVYRLETSGSNVTWAERGAWNHNYLVTSLVSHGNQLLAGDTLTSVSLLRLNGVQIEMIAKDYGSLWPTCAEMMDDKTIIGGNSDYNIFTFRLQKTEFLKSLERDGHYYLGEIVNKFLPGALGSHEVSVDLPIQPKQLFFTPTGQIGVVIDMNDELSLHMTALQRNLSTFYERKTGVSHSKFHAPKNSSGRSDMEATSYGFLDGDFLEKFLSFLGDENSLRQIMDGQSEPERLTMPADRIQKILERLQSMH
ncbi:CPSF A subunit region-domain-containing protein [Phlebopus sp. FC_14]|nr:CPSF A subunit region-domain-containing protein [Phlebopus sp. FC_14]